MKNPNRDTDIAYAFLKDVNGGHEPYGLAVAPAARMVAVIRKGMIREELDEILQPFKDFSEEIRNRVVDETNLDISHLPEEISDRINSIIIQIKDRYADVPELKRDKFTIECPKCQKILLSAGRGSLISGFTAITCMVCGTKTPVDTEEVMKATAMLDSGYDKSVSISGHVDGSLRIKGGDGEPGVSGISGGRGGDGGSLNLGDTKK